jgi:hypothetical protein
MSNTAPFQPVLDERVQRTFIPNRLGDSLVNPYPDLKVALGEPEPIDLLPDSLTAHIQWTVQTPYGAVEVYCVSGEPMSLSAEWAIRPSPANRRASIEWVHKHVADRLSAPGDNMLMDAEMDAVEQNAEMTALGIPAEYHDRLRAWSRGAAIDQIQVRTT